MAPSSSDALIPVPEIQQSIHWVRGKRVMLDADLARFYGVTTKRLNEQVRRNQHRFPEDFRFQLTAQEAAGLLSSRSQHATLKRGQNIKYLPQVFTEHGAIMVATVLNSETAVEMSVAIVRAFVQLRELMATHRELAAKLAQLERKLEGHDAAIANLFEAIRQMLGAGDPTHRRKIGFHRGNR